MRERIEGFPVDNNAVLPELGLAAQTKSSVGSSAVPAKKSSTCSGKMVGILVSPPAPFSSIYRVPCRNHIPSTLPVYSVLTRTHVVRLSQASRHPSSHARGPSGFIQFPRTLITATPTVQASPIHHSPCITIPKSPNAIINNIPPLNLNLDLLVLNLVLAMSSNNQTAKTKSKKGIHLFS